MNCLVRDRQDGPASQVIYPSFEHLKDSNSHPVLIFFAVFIFFFALGWARLFFFADWSWWWSLLFAVLVCAATCSVMLVLKKTKKTAFVPRTDYNRNWSKLDSQRQQWWQALGLNQTKWDNRNGRRDPTGNSDVFRKTWPELDEAQKEAARNLGFNYESWAVNAPSGMGAMGEDDALLDIPGHFRGVHFSGGKYPTERGQPWLIVIVAAELTCGLWTLYSIFSLIFFVQYHNTPRFLVFSSLICVAVILVLSGILPGKKFSARLDVKGRWMLRLCALFIALGSIAGFSLSSDNLRDYFPYYTMRHYTNVAPDEPAAAHLDAAVIVFMEGSRPDVNRAIGYHRQGKTYCTAPISLDATHGSSDGVVSSDVQYWAIGLDCCHDTQGFSCGDSLESTARSGIVSLRQRTRAQSIFQGNLLTDTSYFEEAIKMNMAKFDLTSPEDRIMVHWVGDIEKSLEGIFQDALRLWFSYEGWVFLLALFVGISMPLLVFRDEFAVHSNALKAKFFKAMNYPSYQVLDAFND